MSRVYRSRMAGVQHSARRRKAGEQEAFMDDPRMCRGGKEELTGWEKQQWKVGCFEVREKAGVVDAIQADSAEEFQEKMRRRDEVDAKHRPDRKPQAEKKRIALRVGEVELPSWSLEKMQPWLMSLSQEEAQKWYKHFTEKYGGTLWPKCDFARGYMMLKERAQVKVSRIELD